MLLLLRATHNPIDIHAARQGESAATPEFFSFFFFLFSFFLLNKVHPPRIHPTTLTIHPPKDIFSIFYFFVFATFIFLLVLTAHIYGENLSNQNKSNFLFMCQIHPE